MIVQKQTSGSGGFKMPKHNNRSHGFELPDDLPSKDELFSQLGIALDDNSMRAPNRADVLQIQKQMIAQKVYCACYISQSNSTNCHPNHKHRKWSNRKSTTVSVHRNSRQCWRSIANRWNHSRRITINYKEALWEARALNNLKKLSIMKNQLVSINYEYHN